MMIGVAFIHLISIVKRCGVWISIRMEINSFRVLMNYVIDFSKEKPYEHVIKVLGCVKCVQKRSFYSCCFSWDGKYIVSCSGDNNIMISEIKGDKIEVVQKIKEVHENEVNCVCCQKKENMFVSCGDDSIIKMWKC